MKIPPEIPVYGTSIKGCKITESNHMTTFFNTLRREHPKYGAIAIHIRNEGKRTINQITKERYQGGWVKGCSDIVIPGMPSFVCEMKSQSPLAKITQDQISYLLAAKACGAFVCVALGYLAAMEAFNDWIKINKK